MSDHTTSESSIMGPTGFRAVAPACVAIGIALITVALVATAHILASWILALALISMVIGVITVATYMEHLTSPPESDLPLNDSLAISENSHQNLSIHDLPRDNPGRSELVHLTAATKTDTVNAAPPEEHEGKLGI